MKITIDKTLTTLADLPKIREDMKQFKACYTDNDLMNAWNSRCYERKLMREAVSGDVISATVEAFPTGWGTLRETSFMIQLVIDGIVEVVKLRYYADLALKIDDRPEVITRRVYKEAKE